MDLTRFQNYGLWVAIIAAIPLIAPWTGFNLPPNFEVVARAVLGILVIAGIINNPSSGTGYKDE